MKKRELHFVVWSDGRITVLFRGIDSNGKINDYEDSHTYTADEARELSDKFRELAVRR